MPERRIWHKYTCIRQNLATSNTSTTSHHHYHCNDVIMSTVTSQITSVSTVYSNVYSGTDQNKHQSSASLAFAWGIYWWSVNCPHKWPVTRKMFPFDDIMLIVLVTSTAVAKQPLDQWFKKNIHAIFSRYICSAPEKIHVIIAYAQLCETFGVIFVIMNIYSS